MTRIAEYNDPITAVFPDGRRVYFRNRLEAMKRYGLTRKRLNDLLNTGEALHTDRPDWSGKPRLCVQAEGARFEYTVNE